MKKLLMRITISMPIAILLAYFSAFIHESGHWLAGSALGVNGEISITWKSGGWYHYYQDLYGIQPLVITVSGGLMAIAMLLLVHLALRKIALHGVVKKLLNSTILILAIAHALSIFVDLYLIK